MGAAGVSATFDANGASHGGTAAALSIADGSTACAAALLVASPARDWSSSARNAPATCSGDIEMAMSEPPVPPSIAAAIPTPDTAGHCTLTAGLPCERRQPASASR